jgi:hypothetical protein
LQLAVSRPAAFDVGYIPLTELECYCRIYEIDQEDRDFLLCVFREVDIHYIELTQAKNAAKKQK